MPAIANFPVSATSRAILNLLLPHRRAADGEPADPDVAFAEQLAQIDGFVRANAPIVFTLPGFPCKSPNPAKVLGHLPDTGELLSLRFLDQLCAQVAELHPPGARLVVCSDGHVFGDLIGVPDPHIDAYSDALRAMIDQEGLSRLDVFDLRAVFGGLSHDAKRARVDAEYGPTVEGLRAEIKAGTDTGTLYRGITRFLVDDTAHYTGTRSALQRDCRRRAYGVIRRSRAWSEIVAEHHPGTCRLSIHPQQAGAAKFGIRLLEISDIWTTPWHSCAFRHADGRWELMRRADAERRGRPVLRDGRTIHFESL